ncbi:DUF4194 domain-containing protein [Stutzerimonas tarimensis]|uniref:DUF4194 domain-containing protein n=1 Tax=Stutzerimonas tarimensis TaxID=1507735 RepID=A0ABV7T7D5_9GAMM
MTDTELPYSQLLIALFKGVLYREDDPGLWQTLLDRHAAASDYLGVLGLELVLDEAEGYAYLRQRTAEDAGGAALPRLIPRRQLSYPVSLLLALLRKRMAEFDASGADSRLIVSREQLTDMLRLFFEEGSNEAKLADRLRPGGQGGGAGLPAPAARRRGALRGAPHPQGVRGRPVAQRTRSAPGRIPCTAPGRSD